MEEIKLLESLTNKKVTLKEAAVSPGNIEAADLINTKYGALVVLERPKRGPVWVAFPVVEFNKIDSYLKGIKPIQVQTYKVKWNTSIDKSGTIPKEKVKKLFDIYLGKAAEIDKHNSDLERKQFDENSPNIVWDNEKGQYCVIMVDGNKAFRGDKVNIRFTNGIFTGTISTIAGRGDAKVGILFPGRQKSRTVSPKIIISKA